MTHQEGALTLEETHKIAELAGLPISDAQTETFRDQLSSVLEHMSTIQALDTEGVPETAQVTGLENVYRDDTVDEARMFTQAEALANAKRTHEGSFVVDAVIVK